MASAQFIAYDRTLRRLGWHNLISLQLERSANRQFRASLVVNPRTGLPIATADCAVDDVISTPDQRSELSDSILALARSITSRPCTPVASLHVQPEAQLAAA